LLDLLQLSGLVGLPFAVFPPVFRLRFQIFSTRVSFHRFIPGLTGQALPGSPDQRWLNYTGTFSGRLSFSPIITESGIKNGRISQNNKMAAPPFCMDSVRN
jgi:hypothetical protein